MYIFPNKSAGQINEQVGNCHKIHKRAHPNKNMQAGFWKILQHK